MAVLKKIRWLSMHIAVGAICILYLVDHLQRLELPLPIYTCLFTAVWSVYLIDHKIDAQAANIQSPRRRFHRKSTRLIEMLIVLNVVLGIFSAFFLPLSLIVWGVCFGGLALAYLRLARQLGSWQVKEILSAGFYGLGVMLAPLYYGELVVNVILTTQLVILALANLLLFSLFERDTDEAEGFSSLVTEWGVRRSELLIRSLLLLAIVSAASLMGFLTWRFQVFILCSAALLLLILARKEYFGQSERYRVLGDLIFIFSIFLAP